VLAAVQAFPLSVAGRDIVPAMTVEVEASSIAVDFYTRNGFEGVPEDRVHRGFKSTGSATVLTEAAASFGLLVTLLDLLLFLVS
jgi:hypothetical protein